MRLQIQKSLLQYVIRRRNGYLAIACGSLFLNILLGMGIFSMIGREKIIVAPPKISQTFWVNNSTVSPEYLSEMSHFFATLRFNLTPHTAEFQRDILLRYVSPKYYEALKIQLIDEAKNMAKDHITTAFYPVDIKVDVKNLVALVDGDLVSTVGSSQLPSKRVTYKITYDYNYHRLLVKQFIEVITENKRDKPYA